MSPERLDPAVQSYIQKITSAGGKARAEKLTPRKRKAIAKKGGQAAQAKLTPEQKSAAGKRAIRARWAAVRKAKAAKKS